MSELEKNILESFVQRLTKSDAIPDQLVDDLKASLEAEKPPKADTLAVAIRQRTGEQEA